jgi:hypothetical protein
LLGANGILAWRRWQTPPAPRLVPGQWSLALFNGQSVLGWTGPPGGIAGERDYEGGNVLAVADGAISRAWKLPAGVENYRLAMGVSLQARPPAEQVEIQFAQSGASPNADYLALVIEPERVYLARRTGPRERILAELPSDRALVQRDPAELLAYHSVRIERHVTHWFAYFDGELVGAVRVASSPERSECRLVAARGKAWFDAIEVVELVEPPAK